MRQAIIVVNAAMLSWIKYCVACNSLPRHKFANKQARRSEQPSAVKLNLLLVANDVAQKSRSQNRTVKHDNPAMAFRRFTPTKVATNKVVSNKLAIKGNTSSEYD